MSDENDPLIDVWIIRPHVDQSYDELWIDDESRVLGFVHDAAERMLDDGEDEFKVECRKRRMHRSMYLEVIGIND